MSSTLDWTRWPNFSAGEFACRGTGLAMMHPEFMDRLQALRTEFAAPMRITSGYRSPVYNALVSKTGASGPHTTGRAADVAVSGGSALRLVQLALKHGFTGIGVAQKGVRASRYIHLDDLRETDGFPARPNIWSY